MLHDRHELDGVVACFFHPGQGIVGKLPIGADLALFLGHAHMGLVDVEGVFAFEALVRPGIGLGVVGDFTAPGDRAGILDHPAGVQGDVLRAAIGGIHHGLDLTALPQGILPGEAQLPAAVAQALQGVTGLIPVVEVAGQIQLFGAGRPLPVDPAARHPVETVILMAVGKVVQGLAVGEQPILGLLIQPHPQVDVACVPLQSGVQLEYLVHGSPS